MMNQKTKIGLLALLMLAAAGVFYFDSEGMSRQGKTSAFTTSNYPPLPIENPELRRWKLDESRRTEYKSSGRDLFTGLIGTHRVFSLWRGRCLRQRRSANRSGGEMRQRSTGH